MTDDPLSVVRAAAEESIQEARVLDGRDTWRIDRNEALRLRENAALARLVLAMLDQARTHHASMCEIYNPRMACSCGYSTTAWMNSRIARCAEEIRGQAK